MIKFSHCTKLGTKVYECKCRGFKGLTFFYKANGNGRKGYFNNQEAAEWNMNYDGFTTLKDCENYFKKTARKA